MAIRLRIMDGQMIALCAAKYPHLRGDIYLDDAWHHALYAKFFADNYLNKYLPEAYPDMSRTELYRRFLPSDTEARCCCPQCTDYIRGIHPVEQSGTREPSP